MKRPTLRLFLFNVQPGEGPSITLMLVHSFFMGISTVYFETAASALFLARYGAEYLPHVYMVAAVVTTLTGLFYTRVKERLSFAQLMVGTVVFLLVSVAGFRLGLAVSTAGLVLFGLLVWYRVLSILTDLEYWAVAGRLYDVRQAKRLFSFVSSGEVVARTAGAFSVPVLVGVIGVHNLLLVSAGGLTLVLVVLLAILRAFPVLSAPREEAEPAPPQRSGGFSEFVRLARNRYLSLIFVLAVFTVLGKYFVDFAFLEQMKTRYNQVENLAGFFGVFSGVSQVVSLLCRLFVSGRLLNRFGIKLGLLTLPGLHALCTLGILLAGALASNAGAVFWLVVANQGIYKIFKHPIDNPSFKVLYQPLRKNERLAAQIAVEVIVTPITMGLAGGIMWLFTRVTPYQPVDFAALLLITFAAWIAVAMVIYREYSAALMRALKKRIVDNNSFALQDEPSISMVQSKLGSEYSGDVIFSLDLLEKIEHPSLAGSLVQLLSHPAAEVRHYVLLRIERVRPENALGPVRRVLEKEDSPRVREAALRALCAVGGGEVRQEVASYLEHSDFKARRGTMTGLLRQGEEGARLVRDRLLLASASSDSRARILAAQVIGQAGVSELAAPLRGLLADADPEVRRAALAAAASVREEALWPAVLENLDEPAFRSAAAAALAAGGDRVIGYLASAFSRIERDQTRRSIVRVAGEVGGERALGFLRQQMSAGSPGLRREVLESLARQRYRVADGQGAMVEEQIRAELKDATWKLAALRDLDEQPAFALLRKALLEDVEQNRQRIFLLLSFVYDSRSLLRAREALDHPSREKRAYALEIVDVMLPLHMKQIILPLVEEGGSDARLETLEAHFPQTRLATDERLVAILERPAAWSQPWTRACAVYALGRAGSSRTDSLPVIARSDPSTLVRETAEWALASQRPKPKKARSDGGQKMLTIEKVIILKSVNIFANSSEEVLAEVAALLEGIEVKAGETIFHKGDPGNSMYIIIQGRVRVYDGDKTINVLGERDIFGELALLDPEPRSASVTAVEETSLFRLDRDAFYELMASDIEVVRGIVHVLCQRLRRMTAIAIQRQ